MKKVIFLLTFVLIGTVANASSEVFLFKNEYSVFKVIENEKSTSKVDNIIFEKTDSKESKLNETEVPCRVSCLMVVGDVHITATAGNFLSSCDRAARRCREKLEAQLADMQ